MSVREKILISSLIFPIVLFRTTQLTLVNNCECISSQLTVNMEDSKLKLLRDASFGWKREIGGKTKGSRTNPASNGTTRRIYLIGEPVRDHRKWN